MLLESYLDIDLNLSDHTKQLNEAENYIIDIRKELKECIRDKKLPLNVYETLYDKTTKVLLYVGTLSMPTFEVEQIIEDTYLEQYKHAPELGKKLWLDHYHKLHHPYDLLKNRLFKLFEDLDENYIIINKEHPPQL